MRLMLAGVCDCCLAESALLVKELICCISCAVTAKHVRVSVCGCRGLFSKVGRSGAEIGLAAFWASKTAVTLLTVPCGCLQHLQLSVAAVMSCVCMHLRPTVVERLALVYPGVPAAAAPKDAHRCVLDV